MPHPLWNPLLGQDCYTFNMVGLRKQVRTLRGSEGRLPSAQLRLHAMVESTDTHPLILEISYPGLFLKN